MAKLDANYARPPQIQESGNQKWTTVLSSRLKTEHYLIAVDEFAEVELPGLKALSREELRLICDTRKPRKPSSRV